MAKLKAVASLRDAQRLNRLDSPHANAWLSSRPSCMDGTDTVLPPEATAQPLPVSSANPCSLLLPRALFASKPLTPMGDHPLCCKKSGDRIARHNRLRNLADTGLLAPELEKLGILGVTDKTRRRPG